MTKKQDCLLLFDFDGVIVDSFEAAYETAEHVLPGLTEQEYRNMFSGNIYSAIQKKGIADTKPHVDDFYFKHYAPKFQNLLPFPGIVEAIQTLSGQFHCTIVSSGLNTMIEEFLEKHGLSSCFHSVHGADVHTSKVEKIKTITNDFHVSPLQCLFITDTVGDIREAAEADVSSIAVSWGYHDPKDLLAEKPQAVVESPAALVEEIRHAFAID